MDSHGRRRKIQGFGVERGNATNSAYMLGSAAVVLTEESGESDRKRRFRSSQSHRSFPIFFERQTEETLSSLDPCSYTDVHTRVRFGAKYAIGRTKARYTRIRREREWSRRRKGFFPSSFLVLSSSDDAPVYRPASGSRMRVRARARARSQKDRRRIGEGSEKEVGPLAASVMVIFTVR